jgi:hypothetical protein
MINDETIIVRISLTPLVLLKISLIPNRIIINKSIENIIVKLESKFTIQLASREHTISQ